MPFYYAYGWRQLYRRHSDPAGLAPAGAAYPGYDLTSGWPIERQRPEIQTVEEVISRGYLAAPRFEPETALLHDRRGTAWMGLDDVIFQVKRRFEIYHRNLYEIEQSKCEAMNELHAWEAMAARPVNYRQRKALGERLQKLYEEQRVERVAAWKDVSQLKQTLPEAAQQYLSAMRKTDILKRPEGDGW